MMSDDIFAVEGKRYTSQKKIELYRTSGTASDWSVKSLSSLLLAIFNRRLCCPLQDLL